MSQAPESLAWARASLRVASETKDADEISAALGVVFSRQFRRGDLMSPRNPDSRVRSENLSLVASELPDTASPSEHVIHLVRRITGGSPGIAVLAGEARLDIFIGVEFTGEQGSIVLTAEALHALTEFPIADRHRHVPRRAANRQPAAIVRLTRVPQRMGTKPARRAS